LILTSVSFAQDNVDFGLWNDLQITKSVNKQSDVVVGFRFDTKRNTRSFSEQRAYTGFNFKNKSGKFTVQPWVVFIKNFSRVPYYEFRPQLTMGYKFTTKSKVNVTPRVRLEYHAKRHLKNDGRVVPILAIDKKVSKNYTLFNTNEFWIPIGNGRDVTKYRKRMFFGVTRAVNKNLAVDLFYLYQRDEQIAPKNTHKLGLTWKIRS
jgi:Protein of unknown function (DUF2490)